MLFFLESQYLCIHKSLSVHIGQNLHVNVEYNIQKLWKKIVSSTIPINTFKVAHLDFSEAHHPIFEWLIL